MLQTKIKGWLDRFTQYFFPDSNGFYHLPFNMDSPNDQVRDFAKYPFVKHNKERGSLYANTPYCVGGFNYQKLEEGCWIIYSRTKFKSNVAFDLVYNMAAGRNAADGYYMLSLNHVTNQMQVKNHLCGKQLISANYSWTFFKPNERSCDLNFKGAENKFLTLYFNEEWLQKNLIQNSLFSEARLNAFLESDHSHIVWPLTGTEEVIKNFKVFDEVMNIHGDKHQVDFLNLKFCTINLAFDFFRLCKEQDVVGAHAPIDFSDRYSINRLENYLLNHLTAKFPGIDFLAEKFGISESKLKTEFRQFFGKPVFQYFQEKQMQLAKELLMEGQLLVKEISFRLGYENVSKFSAAFKKHHGVLPSAMKYEAA
jgi:AraC-like DNA-binding protein